jgi:hypothetical protein
MFGIAALFLRDNLLSCFAKKIETTQGDINLLIFFLLYLQRYIYHIDK